MELAGLEPATSCGVCGRGRVIAVKATDRDVMKVPVIASEPLCADRLRAALGAGTVDAETWSCPRDCPYAIEQLPKREQRFTGWNELGSFAGRDDRR